MVITVIVLFCRLIKDSEIRILYFKDRLLLVLVFETSLKILRAVRKESAWKFGCSRFSQVSYYGQLGCLLSDSRSLPPDVMPLLSGGI
jgi:hypothetical protein